MPNDSLTSPSSPPPDWEALARYHAGESAPDEARAVASWLAAHPDDAAALAALDDAVERELERAQATHATHVGDVDVEAALRAVKARRDAAPVEAGVLPIRMRLTPNVVRDVPAPGASRTAAAAPARRRRSWIAVGGLAAAAALALFLRGDAGDEATPGATGTLVLSPDDGVQLARPGQAFETTVGRRDSLRLVDGTRVVLAPSSRLTVSEGFGEGAREVTLEGQAHFTATHDAARPFTVRAGGALVRDLGTVFTVRTDGVRAAGGVVVAVTEGRVALHAAATAGAGARDTGVVLAAGDRGELAVGGPPTAERGVVTADDVAWATRGALVYRATPVTTVAADLRRWYGIELRFADPALVGRRLTATFAAEPAEQVLSVIALALGAEVVREGDVATLRPAGGMRR